MNFVSTATRCSFRIVSRSQTYLRMYSEVLREDAPNGCARGHILVVVIDTVSLPSQLLPNPSSPVVPRRICGCVSPVVVLDSCVLCHGLGIYKYAGCRLAPELCMESHTHSRYAWELLLEAVCYCLELVVHLKDCNG